MTPDLHLLVLLALVAILWKMHGDIAGIKASVGDIKNNHLEHIYAEIRRLNGVIMAHFKPHNIEQVGANNDLERND